MTVAALSLSPEPWLTTDADVVVFGVAKTADGPQLLSTDPLLDGLRSSLTLIGVTGGIDELRRVPGAYGLARSIAVIGVGSPEVTPHSLGYAAGSAARQLRGVTGIIFALQAKTDADLAAILEGAAIGAYEYTHHRGSSLSALTTPASTITVHGRSSSKSIVSRAKALAQAVHTVRDLVNAPPSALFPESFADAARELCASTKVSVEVLAESELREGGFGGILGVGQGSTRGPRLVKLTYSPPSAKQHVALVGKGITFDSGGLSLKPPAAMIGMKYDMTGAATVLAVLVAVAQLGLSVRLTGWLCLAENMPSGSALRPGDVITVKGGTTVEVLNTDAEGRLVLADGLVAASAEHPDAIVDVATLTGAAVIALGNRYVGAMGDEALVARLVAASVRVGETFWPMPIPAEVRPMLASDIADIANIKPGNTAAGMLIAAAFLRDFVGTSIEGDAEHAIPWAHLDIAGPANNGGSGWGFTGKGPTGVSVRTLVELAEEFSRQ